MFPHIFLIQKGQIREYNKCQEIKETVQIQCLLLTLKRIKAQLLSSASSNLQAFCLSPHQFGSPFDPQKQSSWSSCSLFHTLAVKKKDSISLLFQCPVLFSGEEGLSQIDLITSWTKCKQENVWNWKKAFGAHITSVMKFSWLILPIKWT